jgi:hypothetical protein
MEDEVEDVVKDDKTKTPVADDELTGLRNKKAELLAENARLKGSFKSYGGIDAALQRLADLEAKAQEVEASKAEEAVKANNAEALKNTYEKKLTDKDKAYEALSQRFVRTHIDKLIADAVSAEKGSMKLLGPHLASAITGVMDKDGEIQVSVKGLDGQPLESVNDLVKALKADDAFGAAFDAEEMAGGGTRASSGKANGNPFATATENVSEQMKLISEKPAEATRLALAAGWQKYRITWATQ